MKKPISGHIFSILNAIILLSVAAICLIPIIHVFCSSISQPDLLSAQKGLLLWPLGAPTLEGYRLVFQNAALIKGYANTIVYVVSATCLGMLLNILAAYVLSRKNVWGTGFLTFMISFTMLFNGGLIPTYMVVSKLGMLNTRWAIIIPNCVTVFNIMIMRTSFKAIPDSLVEAAQIDGAGHLRILWSIILPVSKSILAVVTLFYVVQNWNSWFHAAIYVQNRELFPLQILLREIVLQNNTTSLEVGGEPGAINLMRMLVKYAVIMISILPMLVFYPFVQKYFVSGVMIGSIKE